MKETLLQDSLSILNQRVIELQGSSSGHNLWFWISIAEFIVIMLLIVRKPKVRNDSAKLAFKEEALSRTVDFGNIINSSFHSLSLYDELKVRCHPDLFVNDLEKNRTALALFQEITRNKANVKRLEEIKIEAEALLNIKF